MRASDNAMPFASAAWRCGDNATHETVCKDGWASQASWWIQHGAVAEGLNRYLANVYCQHSAGTCISAGALRVSSLRFFWDFVPQRRTVNITWACASCARQGLLRDGALYAPHDEAALNPQMVNWSALETCVSHSSRSSRSCRREAALEAYRPSALHFPGFFVFRSMLNRGAPDGSYAEVMRVARLDDKRPGSAEASTIGQVWYWLAPGSGIWITVGRSLRQQSAPDASPPSAPATCSWARAHGFVTIQRLNVFGGFASELVDCRGTPSVVRVDRNSAHNATNRDSHLESWEEACPPRPVSGEQVLWAGLPPATRRHAPWLSTHVAGGTLRACVCASHRQYLNCDGSDSSAARNRKGKIR